MNYKEKILIHSISDNELSDDFKKQLLWYPKLVVYKIIKAMREMKIQIRSRINDVISSSSHPYALLSV